MLRFITRRYLPRTAPDLIRGMARDDGAKPLPPPSPALRAPSPIKGEGQKADSPSLQGGEADEAIHKNLHFRTCQLWIAALAIVRSQ